MASERVGHGRIKHRVAVELDRAIRRSSVDCEALPDGMTVNVDDHTAFGPDAAVNGGGRVADAVVVLPEPAIVVEVLSPSSGGPDTSAKLDGYFKIATVMHYLIARTDKRLVIHHRRAGDRIETRLWSAGELRLEPPGIAVDIARFYDS